jgi:hypothetical protein
VDATGRPLPRVFAMLAHTDAVNGAHYVLMHAWIRLAGTSAAALRLPSLLAMAVAAVITAAIGGRLARADRLPAPAVTGVVAGLLFTAAPQVTRYGGSEGKSPAEPVRRRGRGWVVGRRGRGWVVRRPGRGLGGRGLACRAGGRGRGAGGT